MVDNGSSDGSIEYVKNNFPSIKIVKNKTNKGVGSGFNSGISISQGKYIVNLANDTSVHPNFFDELVKVLEDDATIGACQHKILLMRDNKILDAVGSFLTQSGFLIHQGIFQEDEQYDKVQEIFTAKGSAISFRRSVLDAVGVYDPEIFLYFEDVDLCWRIWLYGFKIVFVPKSAVYHCFGGTLPRIPSFYNDYQSFRNRLRTLLIYLYI
jgi:GT2 family glycosyltransferase